MKQLLCVALSTASVEDRCPPESLQPSYVLVAIRKTPNGPPERRQWALVGWKLQTLREDAGVGAKEHGRVPYMRRTKKVCRQLVDCGWTQCGTGKSRRKDCAPEWFYVTPIQSVIRLDRRPLRKNNRRTRHSHLVPRDTII